MASIKNDDLLLVNSDREGHNKSYAIDGELFKKEFGSFFVEDNSDPIIKEVILTSRTPNSSFRFENETFDFTTEMLQPGDPLPGYGLKASVGGALYEDLITTEKIVKVEGGGTTIATTDLIKTVDPRPKFNQVDKWSDGEVNGREFDPSYPCRNIFNGSNSSYARARSGSESRVEFSAFPVGSIRSLRLRARTNRLNQKIQQLQVNRIAIGSVLTTSWQWIDVIETLKNLGKPWDGHMADIRLLASDGGTPDSQLAAIEVNGSVLLDADPSGGFEGSNLTFLSDTNIDLFEVGDEVQPGVNIVEVNQSSNLIGVDGGDWIGTDGSESGAAPQDDKLAKGAPYDVKLTVDGPKDLEDISGGVLMTDKTKENDLYQQSPYKLTTTDIESVDTLIYSASGDNTNAINVPGSSGDATWENAFNGTIDGVSHTNGAQPEIGTTMTWNGSISIPEGSTVTLVYFKQGTQTQTISINNNPIATVVTAGNSDWNTGTIDITAEAGSKITEMSIARDSSGSNSAIGISGIQIDGEYLIDGANKVLTFPDSVSTNPDLQYFKPGDVVQTSRYVVGGNPYVFGKNSTPAIDRTLNLEVIPGVSFFTGITSVNDNGAEGLVYYYDANGTRFNTWDDPGYKRTASNLTPESAEPWLVPSNFVSPVTRMTWTNNASAVRRGTIGFSYDGVTIETEADVKSDVKVVSILPDSNQMVVDGGEWAQGDIVEYQTKGGEGTILSVNTDDNTLLLSNTGDSDNRWIAENSGETGDAANSKDFFVTNNQLKVIGDNGLFLKFENDGVNNRVIVKDLVEKDPGWHVIPRKDYALTFERIYGSTSIENIITEGGSIRVNVKAANYVGEDNKWSNILIPELPLSGLSDVITLSEGSKGDDVTVLDLKGLNNSTAGAGDEVLMTDLDGTSLSYTMETNDIVDVQEIISSSNLISTTMTTTSTRGSHLSCKKGNNIVVAHSGTGKWLVSTSTDDGLTWTTIDLQALAGYGGHNSMSIRQLWLGKYGSFANKFIINLNGGNSRPGYFGTSDDGITWNIKPANGNPYFIGETMAGTIVGSGQSRYAFYWASPTSNVSASQPGLSAGAGNFNSPQGFYSSGPIAVNADSGNSGSWSVYRSTTGNGGWSKKFDGTGMANYSAVSNALGKYIVMDSSGKMWVSSNQGDSWSVVAGAPSINQGLWSEDSTGTIAYCIRGGVQHSTENFSTFTSTPIDSKISATRLNWDPANGEIFGGYSDPETFSRGKLVTLTFDDPNPDLKYFRDGDVIQGGGEKINTIEFKGYSSCHWIKLDGEFLIGDYAGNCTNSSGGPLTNVNGSPAAMFDGDPGTYCQNIDKQGILIDLSSYNIYAKTFEVEGSTGGSGGAGIGGLVINGVELTNGDYGTPTVWDLSTPEHKVVSTDLDNNKMVVTGGDWHGIAGDGTETGNTTDGERRVNFGPVTGEGTITNIDDATKTYTISPNNGRFIDWTNSDSGNNFTHNDQDPSPQQFAVRLKAMPYLDANNSRHVDLFNNLDASITDYKDSYLAPDETYFYDYKTQAVVTGTYAYTQYGLTEPDNKNLFKYVDRHPEYGVRDVVRFRDTYYAVHDLTDAIEAIKDKIEELQNQVEYTIGNVTLEPSGGSLSPISVGQAKYISCLTSGDAPSNLLTYDWTIPAFCTQLTTSSPNLLYIRVDSAGIGTIRCTVSSNDPNVTDSPKIGAIAITAVN